MKVSFLITYYNQKEYVHESIQSVLKIRKSNIEWEILVGDDGSTDGTIEEIEKYVKTDPEHIKLFIMPRERGKKYFSVQRASQNRLNLLSHASGDFFCTLDGDDFYCDSEFLMEAIDVFEQDPDVSIVGFGYRYYKDGAYGESFTLPAGACVHRRCFDENRIEYIKQIGYFDDNDIVINSLCYGKMFAINRPIYAYRQTGESVYTSMSTLEQAVLNVQGYDVDCVIAPQYKDELLERNADSILTTYFKRKELKELLGEKLGIYISASEQISNSFLIKVLKENENTSEDIERIVWKISCKRPLDTIKIFCKSRM